MFMWGHSDIGDNKKVLVAWDIITRPCEEGGLAIRSFELQSQVCKMCSPNKLLTDFDTAWVNMAQTLIRFTTQKGPLRKERKIWDPSDVLLL